ncbi:hypothetical protein Emed_003373 [Eimeria media]
MKLADSAPDSSQKEPDFRGEEKEGAAETQPQTTLGQQCCLQSSQLFCPANTCGTNTSSSTTPVFRVAVQTPQVPALFRSPKGDTLDLWKSLLLWLFPNLLVGLVFAATFTACLMNNATIACDLYYLLLLIPSWICLAAAARRRGVSKDSANLTEGPAQPPQSSMQNTIPPPATPAAPATAPAASPATAAAPNTPAAPAADTPAAAAAAAASHPVQIVEQQEESPTAIESAAPHADCLEFAEDAFGSACEGAPHAKLHAEGAPPHRASSSSSTCVETGSRGSISRDSLLTTLGSFEGSTPQEFQQLPLQQSPADTSNEAAKREASLAVCVAPPVPETAAAAAAAATVAAAVAVAVDGVADDDFPALVLPAQIAGLEEEREGETGSALNALESTPGLANPEEEREWSGQGSNFDDLPVASTTSSSSGSTVSDFAAWLGVLGEANISAVAADLSFCRAQSLAATLSPQEQSMSGEMDDAAFSPLSISCLADDAEGKTLPAPPSELQQQELHAVQQQGAPQLQQQQEPRDFFFSLLADTEAATVYAPSASEVDSSVARSRLLGSSQQQQVHLQLPLLLQQQEQQQQQPMLLQQQQQQQQQQQVQRCDSLPRIGAPSCVGTTRRGGPRRAGGGGGGALSAGKAQRRECRAALQYYMGLVKDCCKRRDGAGALRVLEEVQRDGKVAPDVQLLNYVLFACVASQDAFLTKRLFAFIEGAGVADIITYNTMLKFFSVSGQLEEAEKTLRRMRERNVPPDEVSFNLLVNAAVSCGRVDRAWHYVDELKNAELEPDKFTISSLVKSLQPGQNHNLIQRTLRLMDGVDVCEDLILLSTCIDATLRLGDMDRLRRLLARFETSSLSPNAHAYGTLIKAYGRLGNLTKVWGLWHELQRKKNMEPTNYTYGCMLDILVSNNWLVDAQNLFCQMVQQGVVDAVHFSILVKGLSRYNEQGVQLALDAYAVLQSSASLRRETGNNNNNNNNSSSCMGREKERKQPNVVLNTISFNALLHLCVVNKRMDDALRVFHDMECQHSVAPDLISYSTVIKGLCCCPGDAPLEKALSLLDQMQKKYKIRPDAIVFNTLIQGAATRKDPALVEHLLSLMQQCNVPPSSYTLCQCVKLYVDGYVYTALIAACIENGALLLAGELALQAHSADIEIPHGLLCKLWGLLHAARGAAAAQQDAAAAGSEESEKLHAVYEGMWKLVGPLSRELLAGSNEGALLGGGGGGSRRPRRRGGKQQQQQQQHAVSGGSGRQKQQQQGSNPRGSSPVHEHARQSIPQGVVSGFVSSVQRDWENLCESGVLGGLGKQQQEVSFAAFHQDSNVCSYQSGLMW